MNIIHSNKYIKASIVLIIYTIVVSRSSYLSPLVNMILIVSFMFIYKSGINRKILFLILFPTLYLILGLLNNNDFLNIFRDYLMFTPFFLMITSSKQFYNDYLDNRMNGLVKLLPLLIVISLGLFTYMGYNWLGSIETRFAYNTETKLALFSPILPLFFVSYALSFKRTLSESYFLYLSAFFIMYMGFITL